MQPTSDTDYKKLFSELIKKQMLVLGPDITLAKVKNVQGVTVNPNGDVTNIEGDPQQLLQALINQFVELSGMIVKKTMESILTSYPGMMSIASTTAFGVTNQVQDSIQADTPKEPPPLTDLSANSVSVTQPIHADVPPVESGSHEMQNLNKALDELANAPVANGES